MLRNVPSPLQPNLKVSSLSQIQDAAIDHENQTAFFFGMFYSDLTRRGIVSVNLKTLEQRNGVFPPVWCQRPEEDSARGRNFFFLFLIGFLFCLKVTVGDSEYGDNDTPLFDSRTKTLYDLFTTIQSRREVNLMRIDVETEQTTIITDFPAFWGFYSPFIDESKGNLIVTFRQDSQSRPIFLASVNLTTGRYQALPSADIPEQYQGWGWAKVGWDPSRNLAVVLAYDAKAIGTFKNYTVLLWNPYDGTVKSPYPQFTFPPAQHKYTSFPVQACQIYDAKSNLFVAAFTDMVYNSGILTVDATTGKPIQYADFRKEQCPTQLLVLN